MTYEQDHGAIKVPVYDNETVSPVERPQESDQSPDDHGAPIKVPTEYNEPVAPPEKP